VIANKRIKLTRTRSRILKARGAQLMRHAFDALGASMEVVDRLFDRMDRWRHLPSYQLERRADLFFSLYLHEALSSRLGLPVAGHLVPEFPVRIGTIREDIPSDKSYKIDYLAIADGNRPVFVELKTDSSSRRSTQDDYLKRAQAAGLASLLEGVLRICEVTSAKSKYACLQDELAQMGLLEAVESNWVLSDLAKSCAEPLIFYLQPRPEDGAISFSEFADVVSSHSDVFSQRFATSIREWAAVDAGAKHRTSASS
jgi:hypothetical protein